MKKRTKTNTPPVPALANKYTLINSYRIEGIEHAPWNPRTPEELKASHPAMKELIDSVKSLGVVQPIAIWDRGDAVLCIAGNRRLEAARFNKHEEIPVQVYTNITEAEAREITRAENEVRFGVSALQDAKLVAELKALGRSQAEIAAVFGVSEAKICRRAKLLELSADTLKFFENDDSEVEVTALEYLADKSQGDPKLQRMILNELGYVHGGVGVSDMRSAYIRATSRVDYTSKVYTTPGGEERKRRCQVCGLCTGNQPDLFDDIREDYMGNDDSRCLNPSCMKKLTDEAKRAALIAALESHGGSAEDISRIKKIKSWEFSEHGCKKKRSKANSFPYVATTDYDGFVFEIQWGPDPKEAKKAKAEAAKKENVQIGERAKNLERMRELFEIIAEAFGDCDDELVGANFLPASASAQLNRLVGELIKQAIFDSGQMESDDDEHLAQLYQFLPELFVAIKAEDSAKEFAELYKKVNGIG